MEFVTIPEAEEIVEVDKGWDGPGVDAVPQGTDKDHPNEKTEDWNATIQEPGTSAAYDFRGRDSESKYSFDPTKHSTNRSRKTHADDHRYYPGDEAASSPQEKKERRDPSILYVQVPRGNPFTAKPHVNNELIKSSRPSKPPDPTPTHSINTGFAPLKPNRAATMAPLPSISVSGPHSHARDLAHQAM